MRVVRKRVIRPRARLGEPALGAVRMPAADLVSQRAAVDAVLAAALGLEHRADGCRAATELLTDSILVVIEELTGERWADHRPRLAGLARVGRLLAAAEDDAPESAVGSTLPQVETALLYLSLENRVADEMVKKVSDWALEAGYFLGRTGRPLPVALTRLYLDLPVLFPQRMAAMPAAGRVPAQRSARAHVGAA